MKTRPLPKRLSPFWLLLAVCCPGVLLMTALAGAAPAVQATRGNLTLPTYPWWPAVPHPYFHETDGKNIYPYPMLDNLSREKGSRTYQTVVLENEYLRITFLPELGGKIHEVIDKTTGQPMFYVNNVIKPGLIGMSGAWTSGGVEWNTGPQGHTVSAMQPVDVLMLPAAKDGSRSVAIGEKERIYGTKWTVVVTLRPGRAFIEQRIRIYNPTQTVRPYYFWNCTAVPNTPGFRFIYPMTLGCDHGAEKFFNWPIDHGKDLTRGTNYHDASSIFAWHCDQDFFGSYDHDADRGIVAYANHHQLPGKKAWTWGQGGFGKMHQMDLTDDDGPYNEVQTGPLLTQAEVGRLDPSEAVEWQEWWYPVHGIGGFTYANRDLAVNASIDGGQLRLRILGTAAWRRVGVQLRTASGEFRTRAQVRLSPLEQTELTLELPAATETPEVNLVAGDKSLATFRVPLQLPVRTPPEPKAKPETAAELAQAGWDHYLFARFDQAEAQFRQSLAKDPNNVSARTGLALVQLDRDPAAAREEAHAALATEPNSGLALLALASALHDNDEAAALGYAWKATLDPATAMAGRALVAKLLLRNQDFAGAAAALSGVGPWQMDSLCRNRRAFANWKLGDKATATRVARASLQADPLDLFACSLLWLMRATPESQRFLDLVSGNALSVLQLAEEFVELRQHEIALRLVEELYLNPVAPDEREPLVQYWAEFLRRKGGLSGENTAVAAPAASAGGLFPSGAATLAVLRDALALNPDDGQAALASGHILFHLGRHADGRQMWTRAAELGASPAIAHRALGMACLTLDKDPETAGQHLSRAHAADPSDPIVARDLARVLFAQADQTGGSEKEKALLTQAREALQAAFDSGKSRSDFVCLLARACNRAGDHAETARLLDSVRITVWEGSREAHQLFEEAHLALGRAHLQAGRAKEALQAFDRALEYPENLAIGRLEHAREGHIHKLRAEALEALGQPDAARKARQQ